MSSNSADFSLSSLIDINLPFLDNLTHGPFFKDKIPKTIPKLKQLQKDIFGKTVNVPIGVCACPAVASKKGILLAAHLGFDVITHKTLSSIETKLYEPPHIVYVEESKQLTSHDIGSSLRFKKNCNKNNAQIALANSIGNVSFNLESMLKEIQQAKTNLPKEKILIVSIYGRETKKRSIIEDFVFLAKKVAETGVDIIEANLSCPNVKTGNLFYKDPAFVYELTKKITTEVKTPLSLKISNFQNKNLMHKILVTATRAGAQGICGINTIPMRIIDEQNKPVFPGREKAGVSGNPIRNLAQSFVRNVVTINKKEKLGLTLFATGGITTVEHIQQFLDEGADVAMSATGYMWNPYLALRYLKYAQTKQSFRTKKNTQQYYI